MKPLLIALLALASPIYAQTAQISTPISTVPMVITKPGHYYFVANLYFTLPTPTSPPTAITVNATGPVVIDMRGFTLNGGTRYDFPTAGYITIDPTGILIQSCNVTVENGEVRGFWNGITASGSASAYLTGINLEGLSFILSGNDGTGFSYVNSSTVKNCQYIYNYAGAEDGFSQTGNSYINDKSQNSSNPQWSFEIFPQFPSGINYSYTVTPCRAVSVPTH